MNMIVNVLAALVSLAMMLTGQGDATQAQPVSRVLRLSNVAVTVDDETAELAHEARLGAFTDGEKAVFDFAVELGEETLLPIQLGVDQTAGTLTLRFDNAGEVFRVPEAALNGLMSELGGETHGLDTELMSFMTQTYLPAYFNLVKAVGDESFLVEIQQKGNQVFDEVVDRGEGTQTTIELDGASYEGMAYSYAIEPDDMAALMDALFACDERLSDFRDAVFGLYSRMPEESGLTGIGSYTDLLTKTGMSIRIDMQESRTEDGEIEVMDAKMTIDMSGMKDAMANYISEQDAQQLEALPPVEVAIQATKKGMEQTSKIQCAYAFDEGSFDLACTAEMSENARYMDIAMTFGLEGEAQGSLITQVSAEKNDEGGWTYAVSELIETPDHTNVLFQVTGGLDPSGTSKNEVALSLEAGDNRYKLTFEADVTDEAIEDRTNGAEDAFEITELSEEAMNALMQDEAFTQRMSMVGASLAGDAQKLASDESAQKLAALVTKAFQVGQSYDYGYNEGNFDAEENADDGFDGEGDAADIDDEDYEEEVVEDDGVLPYGMPTIGYLPEGWSVVDSQVDTAYDWVDYYIADAAEENTAYFMFYPDAEGNVTGSYVVGADGAMTPVEGREVSVTDLGEGSLSITLREAGVYGSLNINAANLGMEEIGKIIAGIGFEEAE